MNLQLTETQIEEIGRQWVKSQQYTPEGYKKVLNILFTGGHFSKWSWITALKYGIQICSKAYASSPHWIITNLKENT